MIIKQLFLGGRNFFDKTDIENYINQSKNYNRDKTVAEGSLLIFKTSKQHTWLVLSSKRLYCILDDIRKPKPHINWSISNSKLISGNDIILELIARDKSENTGLIDIGQDHKNWLFSKSLFASIDIVSSINNLIKLAIPR